MPAILPNYEYDIFISYRQNDNKRDAWVSNFVAALKDELEATLKNPVSIYIDENPHDGLLETHQVNASLEKKLKCLVFIPIISQTYCDTSCFAWQHEFLPFLKMARKDELGMNITLANGNVASRILPIKIHELDEEDQKIIENELDGPLRAIDFTYKEPGVNRPLKPEDTKGENQYHNQINKVANALKDLGRAMVVQQEDAKDEVEDSPTQARPKKVKIHHELINRNVFQAGLMYVIISMLLWKISALAVAFFELPDKINNIIATSLLLLFPIAIVLAYIYENSPEGFIKSGSRAAEKNPFTDRQKKPLTSNLYILVLLVFTIILFVVFPQKGIFGPEAGMEAAQASIGIIPFRNNTGDKELNHYGVGLASEVRTQLSLSKQFDFISSLQATIGYQNSNEKPQKIGEDLGVTHIVSGMYQMAGTHMQVIVEMVEAASGKIVWSLPYETTYNDLFQLQADIAEKVMQKFAIKQNAKNMPTTNMEAYVNYIKGLEITNFVDNPDEQIKALPYFKKTVELDSSYIEAWREIIGVMAYYKFNKQDSIHTEESIGPYYNYVIKHFEDSWQLNEIKGIYAYHVLGNYAEGLVYFEKALYENPLAETSLALSGAIYRRTMDFGKAIKNKAAAVRLEPKSFARWWELSLALVMSGDFENAEKSLLKMNQLDDDNWRFFYFIMRISNKLELLPKEIKLKMGKTYKVDLLANSREFTQLAVYLDSVSLDSTFNQLSVSYYKALNSYYLNAADSAKYHAAKYLELVNTNPNLKMPNSNMDSNLADMLSINGEKVPIQVNEFSYLLDEDLQNQMFKKLDKIYIKVLARDYDSATELLKEINTKYPNWGNYRFLNLPIFDNAKREHPAFQDAINSLRIPPKITEIDWLKM